MRLPYEVILASASPRRKDLLSGLIEEFRVSSVEIDESPLGDETPGQTAARLAREKCLAVFEQEPNALVIAGDTVVALDEEGLPRQLGKPNDRADAAQMLRALSGRTHQVITGLCLRWPKGMRLLSEATAVTFRDLSETEIAEYVETGEPMDKAGAYAIQGDASGFVTSVAGSWSNVVGLPLEALEEALRSVGPAR